MIGMNFPTLDAAKSCYGEENLVAITNLKQIIFYSTQGCQPKFVFGDESNGEKLTAWYLVSETKYVYNKWKCNRENK